MSTPGGDVKRQSARTRGSGGRAPDPGGGPGGASPRRAEVPGVSPANSYAKRLQRSLAFAVVFVPLAGSAAAGALALTNGVSYTEVGLLVGMYFVTVFGVSVGYHRHFAHRAFKTGARTQVLLAALGSMAAQGPILFWVAVHRRHHTYSDQPGDPHSPNLEGAGALRTLSGLLHAHIGWMFSDELTDWASFTRDILHDKAVFRVHQHYFFWLALGLVIPSALGGLLTQTWAGVLQGFLWGGLVRIFLANQASWCVGSICHFFGSRPFETHDRSGNVYWVAVFTFGEGLQNNHHAFPNSAWHGLAWWQPDLSGWIIKLLEVCGVVWDVKAPSPQALAAARRS